MKKKQLEITLQHLNGFTSPKASLEQYTTPAGVTAEILLLAYALNDITSRTVAELGAGPGIFSIGACMLGASKIYSVELDPQAIRDLRNNITLSKCDANKIKIIKSSVENFNIQVDTVFQNTPFGSQTRHADLPFIQTAIKTARVIYTLHNYETREFVENKIIALGGKLTHMAEFEFSIPRIFEFHKKESVTRKFIFYRVETRRDNLK